MKPLIGTDLKRFLRDAKRQFPKRRQLCALLQDVEYAMNVGSAFRLADAVGFDELILTGITPTPPHPTIEKVGRAKTQRIPWHYNKDAAVSLRKLKTQGYHCVAVELAEGALPYHTYEFPEKVCLVAGHEDHGVTKATLAECDAAVYLPMYGSGRSLNVHVALSIVAYQIRQSG
jgi:tRNA (guanosine-2'-O-)-methyltransferase